MRLLFFSGQNQPYRKVHPWVLAISWLSGLALGVILFLSVDSSFLLQIRSLPFLTVSSINLLLVAAVPAFLSVLVVHLQLFVFLYPISFVEAMQYSFVGCCLCACCFDAGWLLILLFLPHNVMILPLLYYYWLRGVDCEESQRILSSVFLLGAVCFGVSMEIRIISPFLASLIG